MQTKLKPRCATRIFLKREIEPKLKYFSSKNVLSRRGVSNVEQLNRITQGVWEKLPEAAGVSAAWQFCDFSAENSHFCDIWIIFRTFLEAFERTTFLKLGSHSKEFHPSYVQVKSKTCLNASEIPLSPSGCADTTAHSSSKCSQTL